jgi:hypothetical protein
LSGLERDPIGQRPRAAPPPAKFAALEIRVVSAATALRSGRERPAPGFARAPLAGTPAALLALQRSAGNALGAQG